MNEGTATINALPPEVMKRIFSYVGKGNFCFIGLVSKDFCYDYLTMDIIEDRNAHKLDFVLALVRNKVTTVEAASSSLELAEHCFLAAPNEFQVELFRIAARKGRQDIVAMAAQILGVDINDWINYKDLKEITSKGDLGMLLLLKEKGLDISSWLYDIITSAASHGHLDILRWMHQMKKNKSSFTFSLFMFSARGGHMNIIQWGINAGYTLNKASYINDAVYSGNLDLVKWFRNQNTSWNDRTVSYAVRSGNIELLQYLLDTGCVFGSRSYIEAVAVDEEGKVLKIFKWLHQHSVPWDEEICLCAASTGNLDALIYARRNGCPWEERTIALAVECGHFDVVKYCLENDCPIGDTDLCLTSMTYLEYEKGLKILKLLRKFNIPWNKETCMMAASYGKLEALKWVRNEGCPWDDRTFEEAITSEDIATIQYCIDNRCPFGQDAYPDAVRRDNPIQILKLLRFNGYEWDENVCIEAAILGNLEVLRWLRYHNCPWDEEVCNEAVRYDHYDILVYAHENGCAWTKETYACCFHDYGLDGEFDEEPTEHECSDEIIEYLRKHNCPQPRLSDWRNIVELDDSESYSDYEDED